MILVDTGPFVALFDPRDDQHQRCRETLRTIRLPLCTPLPVLTEAFHILSPESQGSERLRDFILAGGMSLWFFDWQGLERAFELMETYAGHPMDLADASLIAAAEALGTLRVFTIGRRDFAAYRVKRGHRHYPVEILARSRSWRSALRPWQDGRISLRTRRSKGSVLQERARWNS